MVNAEKRLEYAVLRGFDDFVQSIKASIWYLVLNSRVLLFSDGRINCVGLFKSRSEFRHFFQKLAPNLVAFQLKHVRNLV